MKLKEQAGAEVGKEEEADAQGDPCREEKASSAEAAVSETFEGEMDNFQTPMVRLSALSFLRNLLSIRPAAACFSVHSAQQSRSLGASPLFHSSLLGGC